jgi:hypothetical protein
MNIEKLNKALEVWQRGSQLDADYHKSKGFISNSFIGNFIECEYDAIIRYSLDIESEFKQAFAIGHLVEAEIFEGEEGFKKTLDKYGDHVTQKTGKPYKWVEDCREFARSVMKHDNIMNLLRHDKGIYHKVLTFDLHGLKWRGEVDYMNIDLGVEVDLKTTADGFKDKSFNPDTRCYDLTFIDKYNYHRQRALYQYGIKQIYGVEVRPRILATSKKNMSTRLFKFDDQERLNYEIKKLSAVADRIKQVISGEEMPEQCEECKMCVQDEIIDFEILTSEYCAKVNY